jgi:hypothetical protein
MGTAKEKEMRAFLSCSGLTLTINFKFKSPLRQRGLNLNQHT